MREWLNNCKKETRQKILMLEAKLRYLDEENQEIDKLIEIEETGECLLSL